MSKTYLILGGGGSFGIQAAKYILENEPRSRVISIGRNPLRSKAFNLGISDFSNFSYHSYHLYYEMDLLLELLDTVQPEVIINFAAQGEGAVSWKNSWRFFETNSVALTKFCEEMMKRDWLERFIQIGTSEMYGSVSKPSKETDPVLPSSPYAASKVAFDMYLQSISKHCDFPMNIIRPCNAYCPGQLLHRVIPKTIVGAMLGNKLPLHGGGQAEKSYIHAYDLGRAIFLVSKSETLGEIFNVGSETPTSIADVVRKCAEALNMSFEEVCELAPDRLGQDSRYWLDNSKIKQAVGWEQSIFWEQGLEDMVKWAEENIDELRDVTSDYVMRG